MVEVLERHEVTTKKKVSIAMIRRTAFQMRDTDVPVTYSNLARALNIETRRLKRYVAIGNLAMEIGLELELRTRAHGGEYGTFSTNTSSESRSQCPPQRHVYLEALQIFVERDVRITYRRLALVTGKRVTAVRKWFQDPRNAYYKEMVVSHDELMVLYFDTRITWCLMRDPTACRSITVLARALRIDRSQIYARARQDPYFRKRFNI